MAAIAAGAGAPSADAHTQPYSSVDLRIGAAGLEGVVTAHLADVARETGLSRPAALLDPAARASVGKTFEELLARRMSVLADGKAVAIDWSASAEVSAERESITLRGSAAWPRRPGRLDFRCALFPSDPQHETYVNVYENGVLKQQELFRAGHAASVHFLGGVRGHGAILRTFVASGVHHIFIGSDHILFLLGLLLLGGRVRRLLRIVTCFTLAHSVTLALATLHVLNPPSRVVEPAIAASIIAIGAENLIAARNGRDHRVWLAFLFGFVHGFGFASVLRDFGLPRHALGTSLLAFNAGVEIGQACILVGLALPLALLRSRNPRAGRLALAFGSVAVILAGGYWLIERAL
jgi:hydrogenase/urease accessory protein HupE